MKDEATCRQDHRLVEAGRQDHRLVQASPHERSLRHTPRVSAVRKHHGRRLGAVDSRPTRQHHRGTGSLVDEPRVCHAKPFGIHDAHGAKRLDGDGTASVRGPIR